jgi:hypothetical protein
MKSASFNILRVGTAITFLWIAILIIKDPDAWIGLVQPWVKDILPFSLSDAMTGTAILDFTIGFSLLIDRFVLIAAFIGFIHLLTVLTVVGINVITVRDIAIISGTLALVFERYPAGFRPKTLKDFLTLLTK